MSTPIIPKTEQQQEQQPQPSESEAEALQKLVSAVLDSTGPTKPKRHSVPMVVPGLRRLKAAVVTKVRRHPFVLIAVLLGGVYLSMVAGRESVSNAKVDANTINTIAAPGVGQPTGSAGAPSGGASPSGSTGSRGSASKAFRDGRNDVAKALVTKVTEGDYQRKEDVACGRFLLDFQNQWLLLSAVDRTQLLPLRRGKNWVQFTGPYHSTDDWSHREHLMDERRRRDVSTEAIIRLAKVKLDKAKPKRVWRLEHIRVH